MENNIIDLIKSSPYYYKLFNKPDTEIIAIFILGSTCVGVTDELSDYDITIITNGGECFDTSKYEYFKYKDKKFHWYYFPIKDLFHIDYSELRMLCPIQLRNICEGFTIYTNPEHAELLNKLYEVKEKISTLAATNLVTTRQWYIDDIISEGNVLERHYSKYLYHLCLVSYYLRNEPLNKDFLREIKRIRWRPVSDEAKLLAVARLKLCKDYIDQHHLDVNQELATLAAYCGINLNR